MSKAQVAHLAERWVDGVILLRTRTTRLVKSDIEWRDEHLDQPSPNEIGGFIDLVLRFHQRAGCAVPIVLDGLNVA